MKIGIVLSGGAVRGFAHIGVLKALEEFGIKPVAVSGVSAGSIVGLFYCAGYTPAEMEKIALNTQVMDYVKPAFSKRALFSIDGLDRFIRKHITERDLADLKTKFFVAITNLNTASVEYKDRGNPVEVIKASCSLPVLFKPVKIGQHMYVDGGVMNNLPVEPLIGKVDYIIGVEVNPFLEEEKDFNNMLSIGIRSFLLAVRSNIESRKPLCNLFIQPSQLVEIPLFNIAKKGDAIDIGYNYAKKVLAEKIKEIENERNTDDT